MSLQDTLFGAVVLLPAYLVPNRATAWYKIPVTVIVACNATYLLAHTLLCTILRHIILRASVTRRKLIRESVANDQEAFETKKRLSPKSEDGDWEKIQTADGQSTQQVTSVDSDFDGVIGFFHPFA